MNSLILNKANIKPHNFNHAEENIPSPGLAIQKEIDARGWNQTDLAQILGVHQSVVSALVTGKPSHFP